MAWHPGPRRSATIRLARGIRVQTVRGRRWLARRYRYLAGVNSRPLFVAGCQRSGTDMLMAALERSPDIWIYNEHRRSAAFRDYRLRSTPVVDRLIRRCPAPVVAFKALCDSHLADRYLQRHERSLVFWIYRGYQDVANSAVRNFGSHQKDILRWIVQGDFDWLAWRGERLASDLVEFIRGCFRETMCDEEAAALVWYMRSRLYFDLGLHRCKRTLLVRYEDLVQDTERSFYRLFDFAGIPFDPGFCRHVFASSVRRHDFPEIAPSVRERCEGLQSRFAAAYERS